MQNAISELEQEKTNEITQLQKKVDTMKQQIETQSQQYDEALRRAENDKQQALLLGMCKKCPPNRERIINVRY